METEEDIQARIEELEDRKDQLVNGSPEWNRVRSKIDRLEWELKDD